MYDIADMILTFKNIADYTRELVKVIDSILYFVDTDRIEKPIAREVCTLALKKMQYELIEVMRDCTVHVSLYAQGAYSDSKKTSGNH